MELRDLTSDLTDGRIENLYCLHGEETFLVDEALHQIKDRALQGCLPEFNLSTFYASDASVDDIKDAVETLPMMAQRRVVIVKEAQDFSAAELEKLLPLVEKPVDSTILVFVATKIDQRKKFFKSLDQKGSLVKFPRLYGNQVGPWIQQIAARFEKKLSTEGVEFLKDFVGVSLMDIHNELLKVAQYIGSRTEITIEDLRAVVSRVKIDSVFELVNAIGSGSRAQAFSQLAYLLEQGQSEVGVLAMITRHFRILLLTQEALREGLSQSQISSRVGVHGFFIKEYIEQAKRLSTQHLLRVYDILLDTDRALKSSPLSSHIWLENLILQSCEASA